MMCVTTAGVQVLSFSYVTKLACALMHTTLPAVYDILTPESRVVFAAQRCCVFAGCTRPQQRPRRSDSISTGVCTTPAAAAAATSRPAASSAEHLQLAPSGSRASEAGVCHKAELPTVARRYCWGAHAVHICGAWHLVHREQVSAVCCIVL
jgi:hypothetical protein